MKKIITSFLFLLFCFATKAQSINGAPFKLGSANWKTIAPKTTLLTTNNVGINYNSIPGASRDIRIYQKLETSMPEKFTVAFNFTVTNVSATGAALLPLVFTSGSLAPSNPDGKPSEQTNQNALGILFQTPLNNNRNLQISPYVKLGAEPQTDLYNNFIKIDYNKPYTIFLTKCNKTLANITVKLDGEFIATINFSVPQNFGGLNYVQAANMVQASQYRNCSATATLFYYAATNEIGCNAIPAVTPTQVTTPIDLPANTGIIDYEDIADKRYDKLGPQCCQLQNVQYGEFKNGYVTVGRKRYNELAQADCDDVISMNQCIVFPGRRTINFGRVMPELNEKFEPIYTDTSKTMFTIFKNKVLTNTITNSNTSRFGHNVKEEYKHLVNGNLVPLLTNLFYYDKDKPLADFPVYCISYKNGDSSKYIKINYFGKRRNINNLTVWNSETNTTINYTILRDKTKFGRMSSASGSSLLYYIGLQTPENPNPLLTVFGFNGTDLITDIVPDKEIEGVKKIHFDYTYVRNTNLYLTSMKGTNGTNIVFEYDCNFEKPIRIISPPIKQPPFETTPVEPPKVPTKDPKITPPVKLPPLEMTPVDTIKPSIKTPRNVLNPKEMNGKDKDKPKEPIKVIVPRDSTIIPPKKG